MTVWVLEDRVSKKRSATYSTMDRAKEECRDRFVVVEINHEASIGYVREQYRFECGYIIICSDPSHQVIYRHVPWVRESFWVDHHWAHISNEDPSLIAYTPTPRHAAEDRQVRTKPGRYLQSLGLDNETVKRWCSEYAVAIRPPEVKFAGPGDDEETADLIEAVYCNGPGSCMSHQVDYYDSKIHPVRVYAAGDLAIAYLGDAHKRVTARTLVWPEKKMFSRIYGDVGRLQPMLERMGYLYDFMEGARLLRIPHGRTFVMPYIDPPNARVRDDGDMFRVSNSGKFAHNTKGLLSSDAVCCSCEGEGGEEEGRWFDDDYYCRSCWDNSFTECYNCGDDVSYDDSTTVGDADWCPRCAERHLRNCAQCTETYHRYDLTEIANGLYCEECRDDRFTVCDECEGWVDKDSISEASDGGDCCQQCAIRMAGGESSGDPDFLWEERVDLLSFKPLSDRARRALERFSESNGWYSFFRSLGSRTGIKNSIGLSDMIGRRVSGEELV
ncbi:MAG TPA: hypothetical protein VGR84_18750 [Candidatus Acidoferrales bacterium]|nr:hypothetical protein [Candidatus Acidoferrales bacterium]